MSGVVTVVSGEMIDECMGDGDNGVDATSVTAELRQIATLGPPYKTALEQMANELDEVWAAVHTANEGRKQSGDSELLLTNFDFVLGKKDKAGFCQTSTTWI